MMMTKSLVPTSSGVFLLSLLGFSAFWLWQLSTGPIQALPTPYWIDPPWSWGSAVVVALAGTFSVLAASLPSKTVKTVLLLLTNLAVIAFLGLRAVEVQHWLDEGTGHFHSAFWVLWGGLSIAAYAGWVWTLGISFIALFRKRFPAAVVLGSHGAYWLWLAVSWLGLSLLIVEVA